MQGGGVGKRWESCPPWKRDRVVGFCFIYNYDYRNRLGCWEGAKVGRMEIGSLGRPHTLGLSGGQRRAFLLGL